MTQVPSYESPQLDLLRGFDLASPQQADAVPAEAQAGHLPVARVHIDSPLPHLDRLFDYSIPVSLDAQAQPGVRVRVKFNNRTVSGWIRERAATSSVAGRLLPLQEVISPVSVVSPQVFQLADALADRYAGLIPDILRLAIPPRVASVEKPYLPRKGDSGPGQHGLTHTYRAEPLEIAPVDLEGFADYTNGPEFCDDLLAGAEARAVMAVLPSHPERSWEDLLASALVATASTGRGALALVPDRKSLDRLAQALNKLVPASAFVQLTAHDQPTIRYRNFLLTRCGAVRIVIGTRSAAYAPVANLGLVACWDDGDSSLIEQRSPYCHARDVLLLRASQENTAALFMGYAVSSEAARLVRTRWASFIGAERELVRSFTPRVMTTGDDYALARDPLAAIARIPHQAFAVAKDALETGPVLIQVARAGYIPALSCQRCRMPARCADCRGPMIVPGGGSAPQCGWCGHLAQGWHCIECGYDRWRTGAAGALRTAEELGRAFPGVPVITSSGENIRPAIGPEPALVIATPGGEPVAQGGYSAALLLDADRMLQFDSLRAPETALRRWFNAAALVRSFAVGGRVVTTASPSPTLEALIRWDPMGFALWEMDERNEIGLPPAVRTAAITGSEKAVQTFLDAIELPDQVRVSGPVALADPTGFYDGEPEGDLYRAIIFFTYAQGPSLTHHLRARKASLAALHKSEPVQIRCDGLDIL
ncbi:primosomal protein N' [Rothia sp. CCM 9416]|uniref:primosomal protein N' n=1 Tax=Rothia sp. CCM 9416 TaxID=3402655 RepID=UPI003AEB5E82